MERYIKIFSKSIILLFSLSLFASIIQHVSIGGDRYGFLTKPIQIFASFPGYIKEALFSINEVPKTFLKTPLDFKPINKLKEDSYALFSYTNQDNGRSVKLFNLKNNKTLYNWVLPGDYKEHHRILNPMMLKNKELCFSVTSYSGVQKIDSTGKLLWKQPMFIAHHSMNLDNEGYLWYCSWSSNTNGDPVHEGVFNKNGTLIPFLDDRIVKLNVEDGSIVFEKSITEILKSNNLLHLLKKTNHLNDPYHINDVQPVRKSSENFKVGDVFISLRHLSLILHYRPSKNEVLKVIEGPFSFQHDIDVLNDSTIAIFNNNEIFGLNDSKNISTAQKKHLVDVSNSNIVEYSLNNEKFKITYDSLFKSNNIYTGTEGLMQYFGNNLLFVEEQNSGVLWIIKEGEVIFKNVLKSHIKGHHHLPNWLRIIPKNLKI